MKSLIPVFLLSGFLFLVFPARGNAYLTIDTNKLQNNTSVTNITTKSIVEEQLPNSYLATGKIQMEPPQSPGRRFDVVFFVSIPVTFYLMLNIMQLKNMYFFNSALLDNADWTYIYLNTFILPLAVAYFDYRFIERQKILKEEMAYNGNTGFFSFHFPVCTIRF